MSNSKIKILPAVQKINFFSGKYNFPKKTVKIYCNVMNRAEIPNIFMILSQSRIDFEEVFDESSADIQLNSDSIYKINSVPSEYLKESYILEVSDSKISISSFSERGLFYGVQTLRQILRQTKTLSCMKITDWPKLLFRGTHLTLGSGHMPTFVKLKEALELLSELKINNLVLEYDDRFPFSRHPLIAHKGSLTKEQILELIEYAKQHHIQIIPLLDSLGHAQAYLRHSEYRHLAELPHSDAELCPSNPDTLKFIKELWSEILEIHKDTPFAHISGDEVFRLGDFCPNCRKMAQEGKLSELYCTYYRNLAQWILGKGVQPIMWNDMIIQNPQKIDLLPKQIIFDDWNYRSMNNFEWDNTTIFCHYYINKNNINTIPDELRNQYESYWFDSSTKSGFRPFPYIKYMQDKGFAVLGSSSASCETSYKLPVPHFKTSISNAKYYAKALQDNNSLGLLNTFWSDHRSWLNAVHGIAAGAAYSWHFHEQPEVDFLQDLETVLCGRNTDYLVQVAQINDYVSVAPNGFVTENRKSLGPIPEYSSQSCSIVTDYLDFLHINSKLAILYERFSKICFQSDSLLFGKGENEILDISATINLKQETAIPSKGSNLCGLPPGIHHPFNIPFLICDEKTNNGSLLGMYGKISPERPKKVTIEVNAKCNKIFFLHSTAYTDPRKPVAYYLIHYIDGHVEQYDVISGSNCGDWFMGKCFLPSGVQAWNGLTLGDGGFETAFYLSCWENQNTDKKISHLELVSFEQQGTYLLAGITIRKNNYYVKNYYSSLRKSLGALKEIRTEQFKIKREIEAIYNRTINPVDICNAMKTISFQDVSYHCGIYENKINEVLNNQNR